MKYLGILFVLVMIGCSGINAWESSRAVDHCLELRDNIKYHSHRCASAILNESFKHCKAAEDAIVTYRTYCL